MEMSVMRYKCLIGIAVCILMIGVMLTGCGGNSADPEAEALKDGEFDLGYVSVEAIEAGNNQNHSISECVGYVLTFSNGKKVYVTGDTSKTDQMTELAQQNIDYAFFCRFRKKGDENNRFCGIILAGAIITLKS